MRFLVGIVVLGVVAAEQRPAGGLGGVLVGAMQGVAVEKQRVARLELDVNKKSRSFMAYH